MDASTTTQGTATALLVRHREHPALRIFGIFTGWTLVTALRVLVGRLVFGWYTQAVITWDHRQGMLSLRAERHFLGRTTPLFTMDVRRPEIAGLWIRPRARHLHVIVGATALAVGVFAGLHWFLDGLHAGYPALMALGAAALTVGVVVDVALFHLVPAKARGAHVVLRVPPTRLSLWFSPDDAARVMDLRRWYTGTPHP